VGAQQFTSTRSAIMNDSELLTAVRESFTGVCSAAPAEQIMKRGRTLRARRRIPVAAGALAVAAGARCCPDRAPARQQGTSMQLQNRFSAVAGDAYDLGVVTGMPAWREVRPLVAQELGERVYDARPLTPVRLSRMTWAARAQGTGAIVIKVKDSDDGRADKKARWCAAQLPALGARGYPVPTILWHGMISAQWQVTVQNRLPGRPLAALHGPMIEAALRLVELQADAAIPAGDRDFAGYVANVLFDDWDEVWNDAPRACAAAGPLCERLRRWLQPVWGLRLPPADYAHNDLNGSNILTDGTRITGVVDWDEFGLGSRALDLVVLAFDCERSGEHAAADRLLARAAHVAGEGGLRCLVSYRAIAALAHLTFEWRSYGKSLADATCGEVSAILDRLQAASGAGQLH
jgi:Phosphotransferase enzyme family